MTLLEKPIKRTLPFEIDGQSWVVEISQMGVSFRAKRAPKGCRRRRRDHSTKVSYPVSWGAVWNRAMLQAAELARKEKRERRKVTNRTPS